MTSLRTNRIVSWLHLAVACSACLLGAASVHAAPLNIPVIYDTFTPVPSGSTAVLTSHTPDIDLPGSAYLNGNSPNSINGVTNGGTIDPVTSNAALAGQDGAWAISIASAGSYTKSTYFNISADLSLNGMSAGINNVNDFTAAGTNGTILRGITLGFFGTGDTLFNERRAPLGITYNDLGYLLLVQPHSSYLSGADILASVSTYSLGSIPITGTHTLSYDVNTATGAISDITFDGYAINFGYNTTGLFTDAATDLAGIYAAAGGGVGNFGTVDNFEVSTPEPASLALLAVGGLTLMRRRRRV